MRRPLSSLLAASAVAGFALAAAGCAVHLHIGGRYYTPDAMPKNETLSVTVEPLRDEPLTVDGILSEFIDVEGGDQESGRDTDVLGRNPGGDGGAR